MLSHAWSYGSGRFVWRSRDADTDILTRRGKPSEVLAVIQGDLYSQAWRIVSPAGDQVGRTRQRAREAAERLVKEALRHRESVASSA
jgi:hypothetical protein